MEPRRSAQASTSSARPAADSATRSISFWSTVRVALPTANVNSRVIGVLNGSSSVANASGFNTGYTYGGGIEYALPTGSFLNFFHSSAVTVKAEYLRYELDSTNLQSTDVNTVNLPAGLKVKNEGNIARIGLNYKF